MGCLLSQSREFAPLAIPARLQSSLIRLPWHHVQGKFVCKLRLFRKRSQTKERKVIPLGWAQIQPHRAVYPIGCQVFATRKGSDKRLQLISLVRPCGGKSKTQTRMEVKFLCSRDVLLKSFFPHIVLFLTKQEILDVWSTFCIASSSYNSCHICHLFALYPSQARCLFFFSSSLVGK